MEPVRTCIGCRSRVGTTSLLRFAVRDGVLVADHSATVSGRGAWMHPSIDCFDRALTRKAFGRALRLPAVTIDADDLRTHLPTADPISDAADRTNQRTG